MWKITKNSYESKLLTYEAPAFYYCNLGFRDYFEGAIFSLDSFLLQYQHMLWFAGNIQSLSHFILVLTTRWRPFKVVINLETRELNKACAQLSEC